VEVTNAMKKFMLPTLAAVPIALLVFGLPGDSPRAEAAEATQAFGLNHRLTWDCVTEDVLGGPETVKSYKVSVYDPTGTPDLPIMVYTGPGAECFAAATHFVSTLPNGSVVRFAVKAIDLADNESAWSEPLDLRVDTVPPKPPSRPGCSLFK
jgi:hypothetical protein